jgi:hypothetical protein
MCNVFLINGGFLHNVYAMYLRANRQHMNVASQHGMTASSAKQRKDKRKKE